MNQDQFKDPVSYPCLVDCVITSCCHTQEVGGSNNTFFKTVVTEFNEFADNI